VRFKRAKSRFKSISKLFDGLEKVRIEAFADFFLRLFGIYGYAPRNRKQKEINGSVSGIREEQRVCAFGHANCSLEPFC
jgi:hypothetical protein